MRTPTHRTAAGVVIALLAGTLPAGAQIVVKANDDVNFKLGILGQFQADTIDNPDGDPEYQQSLRQAPAPDLRRTGRKERVVFRGDRRAEPRQDAARRKEHSALADSSGRLRGGPRGRRLHARRGADVHPVLAQQPSERGDPVADRLRREHVQRSAPTESSTGRDTGFQARGYLFGNRLEYRVGAFQGMRDAGSGTRSALPGGCNTTCSTPRPASSIRERISARRRSLRSVERSTRKRTFTPTTRMGFFDYPLGPGAVTAQLGYNRFDGGDTLTTLAKQNDVLLEVGYFIQSAKVTPVLQFTHRDVAGGSAGDETRTAVGASYWWSGHNVNIKGLYTRISPSGLGKQNQFTVQLQIFSF